jgi:hypothetical protein
VSWGNGVADDTVEHRIAFGRTLGVFKELSDPCASASAPVGTRASTPSSGSATVTPAVRNLALSLLYAKNAK